VAVSLYKWDDDPLGQTLVVDALNSAYVVVTVMDEEGREASVMITPEALRAAAVAAEKFMRE